MKQLSFIKMDGLGNDFVILDNRQGDISLKLEDIIAMGNRRTGIGFDQLIVLNHSDKTVVKVLFYNSDGSSAGACGNGSRCIGRLLMDELNVDAVEIEGSEGNILKAYEDKETGLVTVNMGPPILDWKGIPLAKEQDTLEVKGITDELPLPVCVSMGNPHAVFFIDDIENFDIAKWGSFVETHPMFPRRTNVEFVQVMKPDLLRMRVWERGSGITDACGTGACATLVASVRRGLSNSKAEIRMDGGSLIIEWRDKKDVLMTGDTHYAFKGTYVLNNKG